MVMILMVATICPVFEDILPLHIEDGILQGVSNLDRFSKSVHEFAWHLKVLEHLNNAREK